MIKKILFFIFFLTYIPVNAAEEIRAVWLTTNYQLDWPSEVGVSDWVIERQKQELCRQLDQIKALNMNVVFFQARVRGRVFYHSDIEAQSAYLTGLASGYSRFDPLAFAVEQCHKRGLQCHAWMICMPLGGYKYIQQNNLMDFVRRNHSWITLYQEEYYLDPGAPQTSDYLASIAEEMTRLYDIDGVHLDYIRYPENAGFYPDYARFKAARTEKTRSEWRRDNISRIVYEVYDRIKKIKPWVKVSSAPLGNYNGKLGNKYQGWNCMDAAYQDVEQWLRDGKQDFIAPMMYYDSQLFYLALEDWCRRSHGKPIVPGIGVYQLEESDKVRWLQDMDNQIWWARNLHAGGYALFRARNALGNSGGVTWLLKYLNEDLAVYPPMHWVDQPAPACPINLEACEKEKGWTLSWKKPEHNLSDTSVSYHVYMLGRDVNGEITYYLLKNNVPDLYCWIENKLLATDFIGFAVSAVDRYCRESERILIDCKQAQVNVLNKYEMYKIDLFHVEKRNK